MLPWADWSCSCHYQGVLRITVPTRKDRQVFVLEGRLAGDWVQELLTATRELRPGTDSVFDIEDVLFVDPLGEGALQWLGRLGATFVALNAYGVDLCERLHLRRSTAVDSGGREGEDKRRSMEPPPNASSFARSPSST